MFTFVAILSFKLFKNTYYHFKTGISVSGGVFFHVGRDCDSVVSALDL